jgi:hypothetical protein
MGKIMLLGCPKIHIGGMGYGDNPERDCRYRTQDLSVSPGRCDLDGNHAERAACLQRPRTGQQGRPVRRSQEVDVQANSDSDLARWQRRCSRGTGRMIGQPRHNAAMKEAVELKKFGLLRH